MDNKNLSEQDITSKLILPALLKAGWDLNSQVREQYTFTAGRIIIQGKTVKRGERKRADILLFYKNHYPIAVIEVKDKSYSVGAGMQQGLNYATVLDAPFAYSTNGFAFLEHDLTVGQGDIEKEIKLENFPSPMELYNRWIKSKQQPENLEQALSHDYFEERDKSPRYFQEVAINRTTEAFINGQKRILLVMATGTGKTYTAFQIIWRLWKAKKAKRILFLVDRNILADQAIINDFKHFGSSMTKIEGHNIDKAYEIYLALYQGVTGSEEEQNIFKQFSPDFFDLVIVDECHRGSASENSKWRDVLNYYSTATQIGLTATPKETKDVSTQHYFGDPIYTYSLRQGIEDGFLAPYKVIRVILDRDVEGYRPEIGTVDNYGQTVPDEIYKGPDFDKKIVLDERTKTVAKKISDFLKATDRMQKTIVFCQDIEHSERMRQALINENSDKFHENERYIVRITGDNPEGKKELDHFIDPENPYPVLVTTSKLMTTGVDAQTCKLIVLDSNINSISEFKQIIGRGTRVREDFNKLFFTIIDFRGVTELFADPAFDGDPVVIYRPKENDPIVPPDEEKNGQEKSDWPATLNESQTLYGEEFNQNAFATPRKYYISGVPVTVINESVKYLDEKGKLITESLKDYTKRNILNEYKSLKDFLTAWSKADRKEVIIEELESRGVFLDALADEVGRELDPFDLICHVAFGREPISRQVRVQKAKTADYFNKYEGKAKEVINALLEKYADQGITAIDDIGDLTVSPFREMGTPMEIVGFFGGRSNYLHAVKEVEQAVYSTS